MVEEVHGEPKWVSTCGEPLNRPLMACILKVWLCGREILIPSPQHSLELLVEEEERETAGLQLSIPRHLNHQSPLSPTVSEENIGSACFPPPLARSKERPEGFSFPLWSVSSYGCNTQEDTSFPCPRRKMESISWRCEKAQGPVHPPPSSSSSAPY